jgi:hypothetical protein
VTGFDLIVRLFALVLGFSIAEVLGGFARTVRFRLGLMPFPAEGARIGWLVPLLGLLVVMDQMSFWLAFYILQAQIPLDFLAMLAVLFLIGGFYVVSGLVFPAHPERWPDFDAYYFRVKTAVLGGLLAVNLAILSFASFVVLEGGTLTPTGRNSLVGAAASLAFLPLLTVLIFLRGSRSSLAFLVLSNAALLVEALSQSR